ncbi:MAG: hypothetical protein LH471_00030 [Salinibacterium sp.]|nr:hypothetical protein [Salinibacterium sp.]
MTYLGEALSAKGPVDPGLATAHRSFDQRKALISQLLAAGFNGGKLWLITQNTGDNSQALPACALTGVNGILEGIDGKTRSGLGWSRQIQIPVHGGMPKRPLTRRGLRLPPSSPRTIQAPRLP